MGTCLANGQTTLHYEITMRENKAKVDPSKDFLAVNVTETGNKA
jgi:hypothetical protein